MSVEQHLGAAVAAVLDDAEPDADLAGMLDAIDPSALTGEELAAYVRGRWRVHNRAEAALLAGLRELGTAQDGHTGRLGSSDEFSGDEAAALFGWSRTMTSRRLDLADDLFVRLPALGAALWQGWIDEPKVRAISELTIDLCDDHARHAVEVVLPEAAGLPVMALRERLTEVVLDLDPDWAERRRKRAEARGHMTLTLSPSGTATLSFVDAPGEDGMDSTARVEALAAAVRRLGVLTPINQLRLQVGMRLLNGSTAGMDDRDIALLLATEYHAATGGTDDRGVGPDDGGPDDGGPDDSGPDDSDPDDSDPDDSDPDDSAPEDAGPRDGQDSHSTDARGPDDGSPPLEAPEPRSGRLRQGNLEVRLRLTTALGLDQHPATVPGHGAVSAPIVRELLARRHHGEWRVVLTDADGHLQHVLLARRRPDRQPGPRTRGRTAGAVRTGTIVELRVPTTVLAALDTDDHPAWAPLITELRHRLQDLVDTGGLGRPPDAGAGPDQWRRRRAGAEAERWIRARDRHCVVPGCPRPAHRTEIDHTREHALGGPTLTGNLGAWCSHHHRAKHRARWRVTQPRPGWFVIRTRAGVTHTTRPEKVLTPMPGPRYAAGARPLPDDGRRDPGEELDPDWFRRIAPKLAARRPPRPADPTPAARSLDPDDPPPF
ncbi:DUF222 domain-containing protein [Actinomycetospora rhizophila]|uniref:DUF222 domain-containing protein n=1 Tax=Actinomycetospora rhizophila TaxID=1416876 RepID=A0ABV9ZM43_9PSEU